MEPIDAVNVVELFAGIGGFRLAADRLGLRTLWANDLSESACQIYRRRFGAGELHPGDIWKLLDEVPPHDLLTAGFPCQPFSSAGKKKGIEDSRGTLFEAIVRILDRHSPKYFVLENVKRLLSMDQGKHFATILDALSSLDYQVEWRLLNAMDFGLPQNRARVFIIGRKFSSAKMRNPKSICLAKPEDFSGLSDADLDSLDRAGDWPSIPDHDGTFPKWGRAIGGKFFGIDPSGFSAAKSPRTLAAVLEPKVHGRFDFTQSTERWIANNETVNRFVQGVEILSNQRGGARMGYTIFGTSGVAPTLTSTTSRHYERYKIGNHYRRLTNIEYARIQGFPDDHCAGVSVYAQYALFGNAVPPVMARWVMGRVIGDAD